MDTTVIDSFPYVLDIWHDFVEKEPNKVCMMDASGEVSRGALDETANRIHRYLSEKGIGREDVVAVKMPRGHKIFAGMLGVWKAGAALVIVDDDYAQERVDYILGNCDCKLVLDDANWDAAIACEPLEGHAEVHLHDACFIVYTSGSTGNPKGVVHEYGKLAMSELTSIPTEWPNWTEDSIVGVVSPLNFVAAVKLGVACFYNGWTMDIIPTETVKNPNKLRQVFLDHKITDTFFSPSIIRATGGNFGPYLKRVITGSEPSNGIEFEGALLLNNYGMSEASFVVAQYLMEKKEEIVPIGKPLCDSVVIHLLDEAGNEVANGEQGEICFENPYFRGYIDLPEETEKVKRGGLFHSGDIGVKREDGNYVLVGRTTEMIKINGNRVEPGEIEAHARKILGVDWVAVKGFQEPSGAFLCLYCKSDVDLDVQALKTQLAAELPQYMVPTRYMQLDEIPLLPNNKVNKKALPKPELADYTNEYVAPTTETERALCEVFAKVLGRDRVGIDDDFFQMGGDSIRVMQALAEFDDDRLEANDIYTGNTVRNIAKAMGEKADTDEMMQVELEARKNVYPLTPTQMLMVYQCYLDKRPGPTSLMPTLYAIDDKSKLPRIEKALNEVLRHHPIFSTLIEQNGDEFTQRYDASATPEVKIQKCSEAEFRTKLDSMLVPVNEPPEMYRFSMFETEERGYLFINKNHIGSDGMAKAILLKSLARAYKGEELEPDYYYTFLQNTFADQDEAELERKQAYMQSEFFDRELCGCPAPDNPGGPDSMERVFRPLGISFDELEAFKARTGVGKNALFNLCVNLATAKLSGKSDCIMGYSNSNRNSRTVENSVSCVFNTMLLSTHVDPTETVAELLEATRIKTLRNITDTDVATAYSLVFKLAPMGLTYETAEIMDTAPESEIGMRQEPIELDLASPFPLCFVVFETSDGITIACDDETNVYSPELAGKYLDAWFDYAHKLVSLNNPEAITVGELMA